MHNECNVPTDEKCCTRLFSICACFSLLLPILQPSAQFWFFSVFICLFFPAFVSVKGHSFPERKIKFCFIRLCRCSPLLGNGLVFPIGFDQLRFGTFHQTLQLLCFCIVHTFSSHSLFESHTRNQELCFEQ